MSEHCRQAAVCVRTPGGVTVTLPRNVKVAHRDGHIQAQRFRPQEQFTFLAEAGVAVLHVERAVAFVLPGGHVASDTHGQNVFFLKDRAATSVRRNPDNLVYYEPFAIVNGIDNPAAGNRLVAVPAIRPSFVESLFEYDEPQAKP